MEDLVINILENYSYLLYLVIVVWTFLEGETFIIILGALASEGRYQINVWMVMAFALAGSFMGDQFYFYIGRRYGTPFLARWPNMAGKIDWAFRMVRTHETLFILTFRFIYGIRNISPFVIGMSGISRLKFFVLNFIAAALWANTFAWGGYLLGYALERWLGEHKLAILGGFVAAAVLIGVVNWLKRRRQERQMAEGKLRNPGAP